MRSIKGIALSLAAVIAINTAIPTMSLMAADGFFDDVLNNVTPAGSYVDPSTNANYLYGGSVVFKFKDQTRSAPPLLQIGAPKMKAGCNGVSLSGGFLQLLGLDGLGDQIQNAGTAIVYGILMGLIYTLPALEKVFAHIRQWANWIQSLLQNACQFGQTIGNRLKEDGLSPLPDINGAVEDFSKKMDSFLPDTLIQYGKLSPTEVADKLYDSIKGTAGGTTNSEESKQSKADDWSKKLAPFFQKKGLAGPLLYDSLLKNQTPDISSVIIDGSDAAGQLYLLMSNIFGEISFKEEAVKAIKEYAEPWSKLIKEGATGDVAPEATMKIAQEAAQGITGTLTHTMVKNPEHGFITNNITPQEAAKIIVHGTIGQPTTAAINALNEKVRKVEVMYARIPSKANSKHYNEMLFASKVTDQAVSLSWRGLVQESYLRFDCEVKARKGGNSGCANHNIFLLLPSAGKMASVLATAEIAAERQAGNSTALMAQSEALKQAVATYNAFHFAKYFLNYIKSQRAIANNNQYASEEGSMQLAFEEKIETTGNEILNILRAQRDEDIDPDKELRAMFLMLENELRTTRAKGGK